ncbi:unnamed protein product, partial [Brachionus calyciflorus]
MFNIEIENFTVKLVLTDEYKRVIEKIKNKTFDNQERKWKIKMNESEGIVSNIEKISNDSKLNVKSNTTKINEIKSIVQKTSDYSNIIDVSDSDNLLFINYQQTSYFKIIKVDDHSGLSSKEFEDLWCLKALNKHRININYYESNGTKCIADTLLPNVEEKLYTFVKKINPFLNHCLINWFELHIGKQSENTKLLIKDSDIFSFSFGPAVRRFILQPKIESDNKKFKENKPELNDELMDFSDDDNIEVDKEEVEKARLKQKRPRRILDDSLNRTIAFKKKKTRNRLSLSGVARPPKDPVSRTRNWVLGRASYATEADLVDLSRLERYNGFKYLLTCIDFFSKYGLAIPAKNKSAE